MYASIWKFEGDPEQLAAAYEAFRAELPAARLQLALRAPDGLVVVDTCPARDAFVAFTSDPVVHARLLHHGLGFPAELDGYPVLTAVVDGVEDHPLAKRLGGTPT
jgi:hypothetical protein